MIDWIEFITGVFLLIGLAFWVLAGIIALWGRK